LCGRPRGNYRKVGLCRIHMRVAVMSGQVPGMRKSSW
jgi:small subunit ribosomal protein S14